MGSCVGGHVHAFLVDEMKIEIAAKLPYIVAGQEFSSMSEAGRHFGVKQTTVSARIRKGWSLERVFGLEKPETDECDGVIYVIYNSVNRLKYVGLSVDIKCRFYQHKAAARNGAPGKLYDAMREIGLNRFRLKIIDRTNSKTHLCTLERYYILKFNSIEAGYNVRAGGVWAGPTIPKNIEVNGYTFDHERDVAEYLGVDSRTVYRRIRLGLPLVPGRQDAGKPKKQIEIDGQHFNGVREAAEHFGLSYSAAKWRLQRNIPLNLPHHFTAA